jgi:hypothetical protein
VANDTARLPANAVMETSRHRLTTLIRKLRQVGLFSRCPIIVGAESAPGPAAQILEYMIMRDMRKNHDMGTVFVMHESGPSRLPGCPTTNENKNFMVGYLQELLNDGLVRWSELFMAGAMTQPVDMMNKMHKQMGEFKCEFKWNKNDPFSRPKYMWRADQDDAIMSLMLACYWCKRFILSTHEDYRQIKRECGLMM